MNNIITISKEDWTKLKLMFAKVILKHMKEELKYQKLYKESLEENKRLMQCLKDGDYCQKEFLRIRQMNQELVEKLRAREKFK